jgi:hypothetical protein
LQSGGADPFEPVPEVEVRRGLAVRLGDLTGLPVVGVALPVDGGGALFADVSGAAARLGDKDATATGSPPAPSADEPQAAVANNAAPARTAVLHAVFRARTPLPPRE